MKTVLAGSSKVAARHSGRALGLLLAVGALWGGALVAPAEAAPRHALTRHGVGKRVSAASANRIARNFIGGSAYVVRNEGIHGGAYRIHVHRGGVARHVFVGANSGRVIKTRIINPRADQREDQPRR